MKVILDVMGGDNAPRELVLGALDALEKCDANIVLVGRGEQILQVLADEGLDLPARLEVSDAPEVVEMEDDPTNVLRTKKNSSMARGLAMLSEGYGDVFLSAGSTGALLSGATLITKRIRGIRRAAFMSVIPSIGEGNWVLMDCGANVECTPEYLLQFGCMGGMYMELTMGVKNPRVALLNIGTEESKGTALQRETYQLLKKASEDGMLNFVGNIEARDVMSGLADVVICDGYSGNILLKGLEGMGLAFYRILKDLFTSSAKNKIAGLMIRKDMSEVKTHLDYNAFGGAPLLGISKPVYKIHGSAKRGAVSSAIAGAVRYADSGVIGKISENVEQMKMHAQQPTDQTENA